MRDLEASRDHDQTASIALEAIAKLEKLAAESRDELPTAGRDMETWHSEADEILIDFLRRAGFTAVADAWEAIEDKWYA